jgi:hypothetical protein
MSGDDASLSAERLCVALRSSPDFAHHSRRASLRVALAGFAGDPVISIHDGDPRPAASGEQADIVIRGDGPGWARLVDPDAVSPTLVRLFREGALEIDGDPWLVMHVWQTLFWMIETVREHETTGA